MTLGEKIQALRKQSEMSQEQLAERLTITRQAISRWELNESVPDVDNIVQLSQIFGVSTDYLLKEEGFSSEKARAIHLNSNDGSNVSHGHHGYSRSKEIMAAAKKHRTGLGPLARVALFCIITSPAIFLIMGFWFGWWHPGWLVFVVPSLVFAGAAASDL